MSQEPSTELRGGSPTADIYVVSHELAGDINDCTGDGDQPWVSAREAAELLGRHRTRIYDLVRSGDLVAVAHGADADDRSLRIDRSSLDRWLVAGGRPGVPFTPCNAWAIIGLASGDDALRARTTGLLPRTEDVSRARARLARGSLLELTPRLRRRATLRGPRNI